MDLYLKLPQETQKNIKLYKKYYIYEFYIVT